MSESPRRWTDRSFPPYSFVPGHAPHPVSDPRGHMAGEETVAPLPLEPEHWQTCGEYLYGIDLFNHGYYWEAHEAWESLWHVAGRQGEVASFLKGLIKLAAAGVKAREGIPQGVSRHCARARELFQSLGTGDFCGMNLDRLINHIDQLQSDASRYDLAQPDLLLDMELELASC